MEPQHQYAGDPLSALQEIPLPEPLAYVPQTIGWAVVGALLLLAVIYGSWRGVRHRRANAYRREALVELARIEAAMFGKEAAPSLPCRSTSMCGLSSQHIHVLAFGGDAASPHASGGEEESAPPSAPRGEAGWGALPVLLKRTAIAATSRVEVASLTGADWLRFLDRSLGGHEFTSGPGELLTRIAYATSPPEDISHDQLQSLIALSRRWIRHHHADV